MAWDDFLRLAPKEEGPPFRAAHPLSNRSPDIGQVRGDLKHRRPRTSRGTSSQASAHAAIDNETLDHLLSVVNDASNLGIGPRFEKVKSPAEPARALVSDGATSRRPPFARQTPLSGVSRAIRRARGAASG